MQKQPDTTESPSPTADENSAAVLELALRHLDEDDAFDWVRQNPLAARAYIMGVWAAYAEMASNQNADPKPFLFSSHPALGSDWHENTLIGKAWGMMTGDGAGEIESRKALETLKDSLERKADMIEHARRLLEEMASDLGEREVLVRQIQDAHRDLEEIRGSGKATSDEVGKTRLQGLELRLTEIHEKQRSLWRLLCQIARMEADHMFPKSIS